MFVNPLQPPMPFGQPVKKQVTPESNRTVESQMPRFINYNADYTGCGHWRMVWPEHALNAYRKCIVQSTTVMVTDEKYYHGVNTVRLQRQATGSQYLFMQYLKEKIGCRLVYEIDDLCFIEDIPEYNQFRKHFASDEIRQTAQACMELADEMTVTCDYLRDYYKEKTSQQNIAVIPNYMPRWWIDRYYDQKIISRLFDRSRKKPRILYPGSHAHFDNRTSGRRPDDMTHVLESIIKTRNKYQWVFLGAAPLALASLIDKGEIELHKWSHIYDYPAKITELQCNAMIAPLADNKFNKSKSNLKYIEASALGLPCICQDLCTYSDAPLRFDTGEQMIYHLDKLFDDKKYYIKTSLQARAKAETMWLENDSNLNKYKNMYMYEYGNENR